VKEVSLLAPHKLQQECKCLTAMIAYSIVCERHSTMRGDVVADAVLEYCHGVKHKGIVALFTLMLKSEGFFFRNVDEADKSFGSGGTCP